MLDFIFLNYWRRHFSDVLTQGYHGTFLKEDVNFQFSRKNIKYLKANIKSVGPCWIVHRDLQLSSQPIKLWLTNGERLIILTARTVFQVFCFLKINLSSTNPFIRRFLHVIFQSFVSSAFLAGFRIRIFFADPDPGKNEFFLSFFHVSDDS